MKIGVIVRMDGTDIDAMIKKVHDFGLHSCQVNTWKPEYRTDENAKAILEACKKYDVEISSLWCGWSGPAAWNFYEGPLTLGLVPTTYRYERMKELMNGSDFAKKLGVVNVVTHMGFLPENPSTTEYAEVVSAIKAVAEHCKANGQYLLFETGQETPVTIRRVIEDCGTGNFGVNLDPANLILYGKANPVDALDVIGEYVRDVHAKDGLYPTDGRHLGKETPIGDGKVNFPAFIGKLKELGYDGALTIEREITGEQQTIDIKKSIVYLEELIK